jgi:hypothetical protein
VAHLLARVVAVAPPAVAARVFIIELVNHSEDE